jgi:putative oxidoreductase
MMTLSLAITAAIRAGMVLLFLPFSALDKILNFRGAVAQAREAIPNTRIAVGLIVAGLFVEVFMSLGVLTGVADRACAFVLAGYCGMTALLWKQFWKPGDFWISNSGQGRTLFWDFLKNLAIGAGFLLITFGTNAASIDDFLAHPLWSSHPYSLIQQRLQERSRP